MKALRKSNDHRRRSAIRMAAAGALVGAGALIACAPAWAEDPPTTDNALTSSANGVRGLGQLNQNAGDNNNQANATVIALSGGDGMAAVAKVFLGSIVYQATLTEPPTLQSNTIEDSFNNFTGIAQVNQTTGGANSQVNVVAMAFAPGASFSSTALTDIELSQVVDDDGSPSSALPDSANHLSGSFNNFTGIAQVQQVAGDRNLITNLVAVAYGTGS